MRTLNGLSKIYGRHFYDSFSACAPEYAIIADILAKHLIFASVLDLGCGQGLILARLQELGKLVRGVDGSNHALAAAPKTLRKSLTVRDLTKSLTLGRFDLVICSEVAEHLDRRYADSLVQSICHHSSKFVYFTAAVPRQGGLHHVNEQPHSYWIEKFRSNGFRLMAKRSSKLCQELQQQVMTMWWYGRNSMVFQAEADGVQRPAASRAAGCGPS